MVSAVVLAHQGGRDEVVLVLLPLVVLAGLLRMARRRALQETDDGGDDHVADGAATRPSDPGPGTDR